MIIDGDGHVAEPMSVWTDYLEAEYYPRFHHATNADGIETLVVEDHAQVHAVAGSPFARPSATAVSLGDAVTPRGIVAGNAKNRPYAEGHPGGSESAWRVSRCTTTRGSTPRCSSPRSASSPAASATLRSPSRCAAR